MNTVLVTGATGMIGQHVLAPLLANGFAVHAVTTGRTGRTMPEHPVNWHVGDLLEPGWSRELIHSLQPSHLLHLAWYVEHGKFWHSPENVRWTEASLALVREFATAGGRRVVMAGTCAEYDWSQGGICVEDQSALKPATLYGACKLALYQVTSAFAQQSGLSFAWGRIFWPYGPGEDPRRLIPSVIRSLLRQESALCSHGNQLRDCMFASDTAAAFAALLRSPVEGAVNIATGVPVAIKDIVFAIGEQLGRTDLIRLGALPAPGNDPELLVADITKLRAGVEWAPRIDLNTGIAHTIAWWRKGTIRETND